MFDAFHQARSRKGPATPATPALHTVWPEEEPENAEEIPYIEVGGPRPPLAAVMPAPAVLQPAPPAPPPPTLSPVVESGLMTVRFRAVSAEQVGPLHTPSFAPELIAYHQPGHAISQQYKDLVTSLLTQAPTDEARVLFYTATSPGAGTTTVVLNTAITLARHNLRRVLVLDINLRRPAVASRLGLPDAPGLREVLSGRLSLEGATQQTAQPGLYVMGVGADVAGPARLAGEAMRSLLKQLREHFDFVMIDGPRWDGRPEVVALGCACDAVYLCLPEAEQNAPETVDLMQVIPEQGASLRGCILTSK
jgi:Mrp family chromosome partitioning ATPase